ncbi:MAG: T9SS type A sorting domain-containing protein [Bacteroidetes bacterium]|nr:T9SS type A sorting domain-containing protein [Bacteroidota bacterium]
MRKILLSILCLLAAVLPLTGQTTATDFTANDCAGKSHVLFEDLNDGKVVIICWVMPCGTCIAPALAASTALADYASSHPDKVKFYLVDDYGNTTCNTLNTWASSNGINYTASFSGTDVKMSDYGSAGMPKTIVVGGHGHKVFLNNNGSLSTTTLNTAIDNALAVAGTKDLRTKSEFILYPNPAISGKTCMECNLDESSDVSISIYNLTGNMQKNIQLLQQYSGTLKYELNLSDLSPGLYTVYVESGTRKNQVRLVVP